MTKERTRKMDNVSSTETTVNVGAKGVPTYAWLRARQNALASGLAFRDYLIHLLQTSEPVPRPAMASVANVAVANAIGVPPVPAGDAGEK
jgi:hypothetical protein